MGRCRLEREKTEQWARGPQGRGRTARTMPEDTVQYIPLSANHTLLPTTLQPFFFTTNNIVISYHFSLLYIDL